ncbi:MAG TPA: CaiB/BaiF CoA-transferase family protein [Burkholderiales bacterium]|nr:CaiB/BaiF CoA-transferase family protein [Burkholderiales bacterium]
MHAARPKPLAGIRVLDLTRLLPGPVCTLHLADLGADVIKIEDTGPGDYARTLGAPDGRIAPVFLAINRNKRGMRLDLKQQAGVEVFMRLVRDAHAVVESFRPGVVDRLGVGYAACAAVNPRIVYCAISGYGQTGPYRDRAGHDINYCSYAGLLEQIGEAQGEPAIPNLQIADILGGAVVPALGILAALVDALRSGRGRYVDVSMTDGVLAHNLQALAAVALEGRARPRGEDFLSGREPYYAVYRTADGRHMAVGALEKKFWDTLCEVLERPDLKDCHWSVGGGDREGTKRALREIFASRPQAYWVEKFKDADCCVSPVLRLEESLTDPQVDARGMVVRSLHPRAGETLQFAPPLKMSEYQFAAERQAPDPGADNDAILREAGYSSAEIARLRASAVI